MQRKNITVHNCEIPIFCPVKDIKKFKETINKYKSADDIIGRESISSSELSRLANRNYEMFRKILNGQKKTSKRDYIILIGILLRMDSNTINELLAYYGMPVWNLQHNNADCNRDSELMSIADGASDNPNPNARLTLSQINEKLTKQGFQELLLESTKKQKKIKNFLDYTTLSFESHTKKKFDTSMSLATQYTFENYSFFSKMYIQKKSSGQNYILTAGDDGSLYCKTYENNISYSTIKETGEFELYFRELRQGIYREKCRIKKILNDTRNYGERIGAGTRNGHFYIFVETYNYDIPECGEYYLMYSIDGTHTLFVFKESHFMRFYLTENEYSTHYKNISIKPTETYKSEEEIKRKISDNRYSFKKEMLYKSRLKYYNKLRKSISQCLEQIKSEKMYVLNPYNIYDDPDRVCDYFNVEKEFNCIENEIGMFFAQKSECEFSCKNGTVIITLKDLYRAFQLGFNSIEEICNVKSKIGSIDAILEVEPRHI